MTIKNDKWISEQTGMIEPFIDRKVSEGVISYGLSSFGYDVRCSNKFKLFTNICSSLVDPKDFKDNFIEFESDFLVLPPHSFALTCTVERIKMPSNCMALCLGKSTYARCGIILNATPLEPGWEGYITLEISNTSGLPAKIYANEGIAQLLFFEGETPLNGYGNGKYQNQVGIVSARMEK